MNQVSIRKEVIKTGFVGSIQRTVSLEVFKSEVPIVKNFNLISVLCFSKLQW